MSASRHPRESSSSTPGDDSRSASNATDSTTRSTTPTLSSAEAAALLAAIQRLVHALTRPTEVQRLLTAIVKEMADLSRSPAAIACLLDRENPDLLQVRTGLGFLAAWEGEWLPLEGSLAGEAVRARTAPRAPDLSRSSAYRPRGEEVPTGPALAVPLVVGERAIGSLVVVREPGADPFTSHQAELLQPLADVAAAALRVVGLHEEVRASRAGVEAWRREAELREWVRRYEFASAQGRSTVFEWEVESGRVRWGGSTEAVFGSTPEEFGTTLEAWLERLSPEDRHLARGSMETAARQRRPLQVQLRLQQEDGAPRWVEMRAAHPEGSEGERMVGTLSEVSDHEQESRERLRVDQARALTSALRHEINNPLATVIGQTQLLQAEAVVQSAPEMEEALDRIYRESKRIADLIQRLAKLEESPDMVRFDALGGLRFPPDVG